MLYDPLFILACLGVLAAIGFWIRFNLDNTINPRLEERLNFIGFIFAVIGIWRLFVNAGDLGIILLVGTVVSVIIFLIGVFAKNIVLRKTGRNWTIPIFLIFSLRTFAFEPFQIPSESMIPGLEIGDFLLVNKHSYGIKINRVGKPLFAGKDPEYGDVVVFIPPHVNVPYVKRLIGKPGDKIKYIDKKLFVNNEPLNQDYISASTKEVIARETFKSSDRIIRLELNRNIRFPEEVTVPPNHFFVMGDNRDNSYDSRSFGFVPRENFMGTAEVIWVTWKCWLCIPTFDRVGLIK